MSYQSVPKICPNWDQNEIIDLWCLDQFQAYLADYRQIILSAWLKILNSLDEILLKDFSMKNSLLYEITERQTLQEVVPGGSHPKVPTKKFKEVIKKIQSGWK